MKFPLPCDIPTAISPREARFMEELARGKGVIEFGALLGYSTIILARVARHLVSIDLHSGYLDPAHTTYKQFRANLSRYLPDLHFPSIIQGDALKYAPLLGDLAFIDLTGDYYLTKAVLIELGCPLALVHDLHRSKCEGVEQGILDANWEIVGQVDTLALCRRIGA